MQVTTIVNEDGTTSYHMDPKTAAEFSAWMEGAKARNIKEKLKDVPTITLNMRRQALVMRRAPVEEIAPNEDLVAYNEVYKLKNPSAEKQKIPVTDNEIKVYKVLDPDLNGKGVSLDVLNAKIAEMIATKKLDPSGDYFDPEENGE
jgi:hypothetical protein